MRVHHQENPKKLFMERMESKWNKVDGPVGIDEMEKNQINGIDEINKTVGIRRANEIDGIKRVLVEPRAWKLCNRWIQSN